MVANSSDWQRLSDHVDRRASRDRGKNEVRLRLPDRSISTTQAPKPVQGIQTPLAAVGPRATVYPVVTEAPAQHPPVPPEWAKVVERIRKADRWFAENTEDADPDRYARNEDRYCELMAESVRIAQEMLKAGIPGSAVNDAA